MVTDLDNYHDVLTDRFLAIRTGLWTTLFAFDGVILALIAIIGIENPFFFIATIAISIISMTLIIIQYLILQRDTNGWFRLNFITDNDDKKLKAKAQKKRTENHAKYLNVFQIICLIAAFAQVVIIGVLIFLNRYDC